MSSPPSFDTAVKDFYLGYARRPYKRDSDRQAAISRDLRGNAPKDRVLEYSPENYEMWKNEPWKYDMIGIDTKEDGRKTSSRMYEIFLNLLALEKSRQLEVEKKGDISLSPELDECREKNKRLSLEKERVEEEKKRTDLEKQLIIDAERARLEMKSVSRRKKEENRKRMEEEERLRTEEYNQGHEIRRKARKERSEERRKQLEAIVSPSDPIQKEKTTLESIDDGGDAFRERMRRRIEKRMELERALEKK